jgi:hypothetical protein
MYIPVELQRRLVENEQVDNHFKLPNCEVFTSNYRIFIKEYGTKDIVYSQVSSVETFVKRNSTLIILGILLVVLELIALQITPPSWSDRTPFTRILFGEFGWICFIVGAILLLFGYFDKVPALKLHVTGLPDQPIFTGRQKDLNTLSQIITQRRLKSFEVTYSK